MDKIRRYSPQAPLMYPLSTPQVEGYSPTTKFRPTIGHAPTKYQPSSNDLKWPKSNIQENRIGKATLSRCDF